MNVSLNFTTSPTEKGKGARKSGDMAAFWARPENAVLYPLGQILKGDAAIALAKGDTASIGASITVHGVSYKVANGDLSLDNLSEWGCPRCGSAHGSNIGKSAGVDPKNKAGYLGQNDFFYRPADGKVFTISATCRAQYGPPAGVIQPFPKTPTVPAVTAPEATPKGTPKGK